MPLTNYPRGVVEDIAYKNVKSLTIARGWLLASIALECLVLLELVGEIATGLPHPENIFIAVPFIQFFVMVPCVIAGLVAADVLRLNPFLTVLLGLVLACLPAFGPPVFIVSLSIRIWGRFRSLDFSSPFDRSIAVYLESARQRPIAQIAPPRVRREDISDHWTHADLTKNEEFSAWADALDAYLASVNVETRSQHFGPLALAYGFVNKMEPADFVRTGYDKYADPAAFL